jgi:hypothetical protein
LAVEPPWDRGEPWVTRLGAPPVMNEWALFAFGALSRLKSGLKGGGLEWRDGSDGGCYPGTL